MTAADRPTVTDDARAEAMSRYSFGTYHGQMVQWHDAKKLAVDAFIAGAEWATARAETTIDLQLLAEGWDKCVKSLRYEDGSPVEIVSDTNPYRKALKDQNEEED